MLTPLTLSSALAKRLSDVGVLNRTNIDEISSHDLESVEIVVLRSGPQLLRRQIARLPALRHVIRPGSGLDNVDQEALKERGVILHRDAATGAAAVAELVLLGLGVLSRQLLRGHLLAQQGNWAKSDLMGESLADLDVCVWGAGPVGRAVSNTLRDYGCDVRFIEHRSVGTAEPTWTRSAAMAAADAHVLALPLRESTRRLVDRQWLAEVSDCRPYVVNVGRWDLLDLEATTAALRAGELRGVHIDPLDEDNLAHIGLSAAGFDGLNLLVTQHQGAQRGDVRTTLDEWACQTILSSLSS